MKLIKEIYKSWDAEVVFITSNYQGNQEMMEGCKEAGIPAFVRHICFDSILILIYILYRALCGTSSLHSSLEGAFGYNYCLGHWWNRDNWTLSQPSVTLDKYTLVVN